MADGRYPDPEKHPDDDPGPFYEQGNPEKHIARFAKALQRALDDSPARDNMTITFSADVVHRNPGGIKEYKVHIG